MSRCLPPKVSSASFEGRGEARAVLHVDQVPTLAPGIYRPLTPATNDNRRRPEGDTAAFRPPTATKRNMQKCENKEH